MRFSYFLLIGLLHLAAIRQSNGNLSGEFDCHESCYDSNGESSCIGETEYDCTTSCPSYYEENPPMLILGGVGLYVTDEDNIDQFLMQSAVIEIFPQDTDDFDDIILNATIKEEGITAEYESEHGVLFIDGEASVVTYQSILRGISVVINNIEPDAIDRVICYTIFDGVQSSDPSCVTLQIILDNDNTPSFVFNGTSSNYQEGAEGLLLLEELTITDADDEQYFLMQSAEINVLGWCNNTDVITVNTSDTNINQKNIGGCIMLVGNDTLNSYAKVFLSARYSNSADEPNVDENRTITFSLFDGTNVGVFNVTIALEPVDDHLTTAVVNPPFVRVYEMKSPMIVLIRNFTEVALRDNDTNDEVYIKEMLIKIESPALFYEQLSAMNVVMNDIISIEGNESLQLNVSGNSLLSDYQGILNSLRYQYIGSEPPCDMLTEITVTIDQKFTATIMVEIVAVNDNRPMITLPTLEVKYYENMVVRPFIGINITDEDNCMLNTLELVRVTFDKKSDTEIFKFGNYPWLSMDISLCDNENVSADSTNYDTLNSSTAPLNYSMCNNTFEFEIVVVGTATIDQYQDLLESLEYSNTALEPPEIDKTLMVYVNDSIFTSSVLQITVKTIQINDEPPFVDTNGTTFRYIENTNFTTIVGAFATIIDNDDRLDHQTVSHFCVTIDNPKLEDDVLYLALDNEYEIIPEVDYEQGSGSSFIDSVNLCVNVTSCNNDFTNISCFYSFLSAVQFSSLKDEPNLETRNVSFTAYSDELQQTSNVLVQVVPINDQPHILYLNGMTPSVNNSVDFFEESGPVKLSFNLRFEDQDVGKKEFTNALIYITNAEEGDKIALNRSLAEELHLFVELPTCTEIRVDGVASHMVYARLLASVTYMNMLDEPTPVNESIMKVIQFTVNDLEQEATAYATVTVYPVNDPPKLSNVTIVFNESTKEPVYLFSSETSVEDSDNDTLEWITIEIEPTDFLDNLTLLTTEMGNINVSLVGGDLAPKTTCFPTKNNQTTQSIALYGPASTEDFNNAIHNITFSNNCPGLNTTTRLIRVTVFDGVDVFVSWVYVNISAIDDLPVCYFGQWPGVRTVVHSYVEQSPLVSLANDFTLIDNDGPMNYLDGVTVTISRIRDIGEEFLNFTLSSSIYLNVSTTSTGEEYYTSVYELKNGQTFEEYSQVLTTMRYINKALEPSTFLPRLVTVNINSTEFINCSIEVMVINTPDRPVIIIKVGNQSDFVEDSSYTSISDSADIYIVDEDSVFLYQARIEILNTPSEYGTVIDMISLPVTLVDKFTIDGNGTSSIIATGKSLNLRHDDFIQLIKGIQFQTDDQATNITRQISVVVEEFPLNEPGPSIPILIPVNMLQLNDRPIFITALVHEEILDNFIPPETANPGFFPSYLVNESVVNDPDSLFPFNPDIIGLYIFYVNNAEIGNWQYFSNGEKWINLSNVSDCEPLLLKNNERIRFLPSNDIISQSGATPFFNYSVWDGTSTDICNEGSIISNQEASISVEKASFLYIVMYYPPLLYINESLFTFTEDSNDYPMIFRSISLLATSIANARVEIYCELCLKPISGFEIIASSLDNFSIEMSNSTDIGVTSFVILSFNLSAQHWELFLRSLKYINTADEPEPVLRTIILSVSDGLTRSNGITVNVSVVQINDPPVVMLNQESIMYVGQFSGTVILAPNSMIFDPDNDEIGGLIISLSGNVSMSENETLILDEFVIPSNVDLLYSNSSEFDDNILISIELYGVGSTVEYTALLRSLMYKNSDIFPDAFGTRFLIVQPLDIEGSFGFSDILEISYGNINPPPVIDLNGPNFPSLDSNVEFVEGSMTSVLLAENATITDVNENGNISTIVSILITLYPHVDAEAEFLSIAVIDGIVLTWVVQNSSLMLTNSSHTATTQYFTQALRTLAYTNIAIEPSALDRYVSIVANDGGVNGNTAIATINVINVNDPPIISLNGKVDFIYNETGNPVNIFVDPTLTDVDSSVFTALRIFRQANTSGDVIASSYFQFVYNNDNLFHTFTFINDTDFVISLIKSITFSNFLDEPTTEERQYCISIKDKIDWSEIECVTIKIIPANDSHPYFPQPTYTTSVVENKPYTPVIQLEVFDNGNINMFPSYEWSITAGDECHNDPLKACSFQIDNNGLLSTTDVSPDREKFDEYTLKVTVSENGFEFEVSTIVRITVNDTNDNSPTFSQISYNISIQEKSFGTLRLSAIDLDLGENGSVKIDVINKSDIFVHTAIDLAPIFDVVIELNEVDYETTKVVTAQIVASDNGLISLSSSTLLTIFVEDANDNRPFFDQQIYTGEVPENTVNYFITSVSATDLDSGLNGKVQFGIENYENDFAINELTGSIMAIRELDFEEQCFYQLQVVAYDLGIVRLTATATVDIAVTASNDEPPNFNQSVYHGSVFEKLNNEPFIVPMFVTQVFAFDDDLRSVCNDMSIGSGFESGDILELTNVTYSLLNHKDYFIIDSTTGVITTLRNFDRETVSQYILVVSAIDSSSLSSNVTVIVTIEDINDNNPTFSEKLYEVSIPENFPVNISFLQVIATDLDFIDNGKLQYAIISDESGIFQIKENSGNISFLSEFDYESEISKYSLFIIVRDLIDNFNVAEVTVFVEDVNDSPPNINASFEVLLFMEGQVSLMPFTEISVSDSDSFPHIFSAVISLESPEKNINSNTNCFCSNASDALSCKEGCNEFLQISTTSFPGNISVSEDGYAIILSGCFVTSVYESSIEAIQYINIITNPLADNRNISVTVNDGILNSSTHTNMIQMLLLNQFAPVIDLNGPIKDGTGNSVNFTEEGSAVLLVSQAATVTDNDSFIAYPMITMLEVWLVNPLDGDEEAIQLEHEFGLPNALTLSTLQHRLVVSGAATNMSYISVLRHILYINTASEPTPTERSINFRVTEYHLSSEIATTNVTVITMNDHSPNLLLDPPSNNNYDRDYKETDGQIQLVPSIAFISDQDSSEDNLVMMEVSVLSPGKFDDIAIVGDNITQSDIVMQKVSQTSLLLEGSAPLQDYENILKRIYYSFTAEEFTVNEVSLEKFIFIKIADDSFSSFSVARLMLKPENDQQPTLEDTVYIVEVSENATIGSSIFEFVAADGDTYSQSQIQYSIFSGNDNGFFILDTNTGVISIGKALDFEQNIVHTLTVMVEDLLHDTGAENPFIASLEVIVGDVNDNVPQFNQSSYYIAIQEVPSGTFVLQIVAIDFDSNLHSQLIYDIIGTSDFSINNNGVINTSVNLDYESVITYLFNVTVRNPGSLKQDNVEVIVEVLDIDDNPPALILDPIAATLVEPNNVIKLAQSLSISDLDALSTLNMANINIANGPGYLSVPSLPDQIVANGNDTQMLILIGIESISVYESILRSIVYVDLADEPVVIERLVIYQIFSDHFNTSKSFQIFVEVINDHIPLISLDSGSSTLFTNFTENSPPVPLSDRNVSITDDDEGMIIYAIVELLMTPDGTNEKLELTLSDGLLLDSASSEKILIVTGNRTLNVYESVLSTVTYVNTAEEPTVMTRVITFIVNDGLFNSTEASAFVTIITVNDPPIVTLDSSSLNIVVTYLEGQMSPLVLAPQLEIQDSDSELLAGANVFLIDPKEDESLNISVVLADLMQISIDDGIITIISTSGLEINKFKEVLRSVTYFSTRETPFPYPRQVAFSVVDTEGAQSLIANVIIMFNSSDATSQLDLNGPLQTGVNFTTTFIAGTGIPIRIVSSNASAFDNNSDMGTSVTVTILVTFSGDLFAFPEHTNVSKTEINNTIEYKGLQPISVYIDVLLSFTFTNLLEEHSNADRRILFQLFTQGNDDDGVSVGSNIAETTIKILNINDLSFDQNVYNGFVHENSNAGTSTGVVVAAVDNDIHNNTDIIYYIQSGSSDFYVDMISGVITTLQPLDADEMTAVITFVVVAEDNVNGIIRTATTLINITIGDINDNPPVFASETYNVTVTESASIGSLVFDVIAIDKDYTAEHSTIMYMLNLDSASGSGMGMGNVPFVIDASSGQVFVAEVLDAESSSSYTIEIIASDGVYEVQTNIEVTVQNSNEHFPVFINEPYMTEVLEDVQPGKSVFNVKAIDADLNEEIMYFIEGTDLFDISHLTGDIFVNMPLDYEVQTSIEFTVVATDSGSLSVSSLVVISIVNVNDNLPMITFENSSMLDYIEEHGTLLIGIETGIRLKDGDSNFPIKRAEVFLTGAQDSLEQLILAVDEIENVTIISNISAIYITGDASAFVYENLIRSVSYINLDTEPASGIRRVTIKVNDGNYETKAELLINVININDNPVLLTSNTTIVSFIEGIMTLPIGKLSDIVVSDIDEQPMLDNLSVKLDNILETEKELISIVRFGEVINDSELIIIDQTDSLLNYQDILRSLTYIYNTNGDEPLPGIRMITVSASNGKFTASLVLQVRVEIINNQPPILSFNGSSAIKYNESSGQINIGALFLPVIYDGDSNSEFLMTNASVQLVNGIDGENEHLNVDSSIMPSSITVQVFHHHIIFNGNATVSDYQLAFRAITYENTASEPTQVNRSVVYRASDGKFESNILVGYLIIGLINDNNLNLSCSSKPLVFIEGGVPMTIGSSILLSDLDVDNQISNATIAITNPQNGDEFLVDSVDNLLVIVNGTTILINGVSTAAVYQELLQSILYLNTADEPCDTERLVFITIYQFSTNITCSISININLINDNSPVVDLSGPDEPTINRNTSLNFGYPYSNRVSISSENATVSDADIDSVIQNITVSFKQKKIGDRLILNPDICYEHATAATCFINTSIADEYSNCSCGVALSYPSDLMVTISSASISVMQTIPKKGAIQAALRKLVLFEHSPDLPDSSYTSEIDVVVNDGIFESVTATVSILVNYQNIPPTVFTDSQQQMTFGEVEMSDGQTIVTLVPNILVIDDAGYLSKVIIELTNSIHNNDESISLTLNESSLIQKDGISNATYLVLSGKDTIAAYSFALQSLQFNYLRMTSLLEQQPNVSDRNVTITAIDCNEAIGQPSTVVIKFNRACNIWSSMDSTIRVPLDLSIEELSICTSVSAFHIRITGNISSLLPLRDLQRVDTMSLISLPNLETLEGLENLAYFSELVIDNLDSLESMDELGSNLPSDHRITVQSIGVRNCSSLNSINGMRIIENITSLVQIQKCNNLIDLSGLDNLVFAGTLFLVQIPIIEIVSFNKLFKVSDLWIYRNDQLESVTGFQNLRSLETLNLITNKELLSIDGLSGLQKVDLVRTFMNLKLCHIGNETTIADYWKGLGAQTIGDFNNDCTSRNCSDNPCLNDGQCIQTHLSYECHCGDSYFGSNCQYFNECTTTPCQNDGSCLVNVNIDDVQQYVCLCSSGISGFNCETFT